MIRIFIVGSTASLVFNGPASVAEYEFLLRSLTYINTNVEPMPGNRSISITLSDGIHQDMTAVIVIVILTNDNPLSLRAGTTKLTYTEGDTGIAVGTLSGVTLVDADNDAMIEFLVISLNGSFESGESLVVDTSSVVPGGSLRSGVEIELTQTSSLQNYQVI